jgi:hypothetical protein
MRGIHFYDFADRPGVDLLLGLEHWRLFRSLHEYPSGPREPLVRRGFFGNTVINGPPLQEDSIMVWDEDFGGEEKEEEKIEGVELQLEDGHPVMLIQDAGEIDGAGVLDEEDDELTNKEVATCLPEDHRSKNVSGEHSVLGIVWNTLTDVFKYPKYDLTPWLENMSRKTMLQQVASIYDPWGGACPSLTKPNNTNEVQVENPCKRAKITPECTEG